MAPDRTGPRVLHLITRYLNGGAETTTDNALQALSTADEGYDVRLGFGADYDEPHVTSIEAEGIQTTVFRSLRHYDPFTAVVAVGEVTRHLIREDIHVLHTHSTEAGIIGRLAARIADTPVVIHEIHGDPIAADRNPMLNAAILQLERLCASVTTRFVVKSERIRETYLERGIGRPGQYDLIYHGVDIDRFKNAAPATDIDANGTTVLFVGRLEEGKGLFDLLAAFETLSDRYNVSLLIAGKGPLMESLHDEIHASGLEECIHMLGYRTDVPNVLQSADVFVLPSYREGTPRVITEALSAGLPVVSTAISGIPDQVTEGQTGYLVTPGDRTALEEQLATLISTPELRAEMGERARKSVHAFDRKSKADEYRDLYRQIMAGDD